MSTLKSTLFILLFILGFQVSFAQTLSAEQAKALVKAAVEYALDNRDPNMDYSKYVTKDFINPIDDSVFNYEQWVTHQKHIKEMVRSMKPTFDVMVAEGNKVAAIFRVHIVKKDGSELEVKDLAFFTLRGNKISYVEELTKLIQGEEKDKNISSTK